MAKKNITMKKKSPAIKPTHVVIKKTIEIEETYTVLGCGLSIEELQGELQCGNFNLIQSATVEPYVNVVDTFGKRVGLLEKDGGFGPDEKCKVIVN